MSRRSLIYVLLVTALAMAGFADNRYAHQDLSRHESRDKRAIIHTQILSCQRVNGLRTRFNERGQAMILFLKTELKISPKALKTLANAYGPIALTNCEKAFNFEKGSG